MKNITTRNYKKAQSKIMYILRGLPGSGKSTLAEQLAGETGQTFEADDFFIQEDGSYQWSGNLLPQAHQWNYERMKRAIEQGVTPVILDNTNISKWDLRQARPLVEYAENQGYEVRIEEVQTPWAFDPVELAKKNKHSVPQEAIEAKIRKWYPNPTVDDIRNDFQPQEMR